jgi:hypothetical protein
MHRGLNSNRTGPDRRPADGIVSDSGNDWALGKSLVLSHGFGMITRMVIEQDFGETGAESETGSEKIAEIGSTENYAPTFTMK